MSNTPTSSSSTISSYRELERFVEDGLICNISSLIHTLANGVHAVHTTTDSGRHLAQLCKIANGLSSPMPDYQSAATEAGFRVGFFRAHNGYAWYTPVDEDGTPPAMPADAADWTFYSSTRWAWIACCDANALNPYENHFFQEPFEHWIITSRFADLLEELGEIVERDFDGNIIWARCTTGQAVWMDSCIQEAYALMQRKQFSWLP